MPAGGFAYQSINGRDLTITGGWIGTVNVPRLVNNGFVSSTRLNGQHSERIFEVISNINPLISLTKLSYINGQTPAGEPGGALFTPDLLVFTGGIVLGQTYVADNAGTQGAAIRINQASGLELANSVLDGNLTASGGVRCESP